VRFFQKESIALISGAQQEFIEISQTVEAGGTFADKIRCQSYNMVEGEQIFNDYTILLLIGYLCNFPKKS